MYKVNLLDCTLRDGGYVVDTCFGHNTIVEIIRYLVESGIDIIECGFLRNAPGEDGSTVFSLPHQLRNYLPEGMEQGKYVLMFDAGRFDVGSLPDNDGTIFGVRDCFHKEFREQAFEDARILKEKGYEVFIQPTGILQYTDREILDLIDMTNALGAYSFAIVDTFGSMEKTDLVRLFSLIHHNLAPGITLGFHSHNNQQMAYALSQDFVALGSGKRDLLVDTTVYGMGRGAGNACTESMAFHLNKHYGKQYDTDKILDLIESQILQIYSAIPWGYNVRHLVAGIYGCHIDNVSYLYDKGNLPSSDVKRILEDVPSEYRTHFHQDVLESSLTNYRNCYIDDTQAIADLQQQLQDKEAILICPGRSLRDEVQTIRDFCNNSSALRIGINFVPQDIPCDYLFFSNPQRVHFWMNHLQNFNGKIIFTSNIDEDLDALRVNHHSLVSAGRKYGSNATVMCLRLLDRLKVGDLHFMGFDGYAQDSANYVSRESESSKSDEELLRLNHEISSMLSDFRSNTQSKRRINFITASRFEEVFL